MKQFLTIIILIFATGLKIHAVPAYPYPIEYQLPDGTTITITLKGDENISWATSADGYTLLVNNDGFYEYAILDENGALVLSGIRAKNIEDRSREEIIFLENIQKNLRYNSEQISYMFQINDMRNSMAKYFEDKMGAKSRNSTVEVRFPLILVGFRGKPFTLNKSQFEALLNQPNYTSGGITGSVYDYFYACSYEQVQFKVDIFGPYTLNGNVSVYDHRCENGDPRKMAREAAIAASNDGCDFSRYDSNGDGIVDGIHIIFAGYGQEAGAPQCQSIWSHAWAIFPDPPMLNGVHVYRYSCSPEYRNNTGNNITYIGVIAHELAHVFGLPDFYDTDYDESGGRSVDLGPWCLMASGSWNDNGRTPANISAWGRVALDWVNHQTLTAPATITLPNPQNEGWALKINTTTANEYFLLENRQKVGWDAFVPGNGMIIYHVDENNPGWNNNCINCNPNRRGNYIKQAGGGFGSAGAHNTAPYPFSGNNSFTDNSIPNSHSWLGFTGINITNIISNTQNRTISFDFKIFAGFPPNDPTAIIVGNDAVINWEVPGFWLNHCNNDNVIGKVGWQETSGNDMTAAIRFYTSDLANIRIFSKPTLHKIKIGVGTDMDLVNTMEIRIWANNDLEYTQPVTNYTSFTENAMNDVILTKPYVITTSKDLRLGYRVVNSGGYPFGIAVGPNVSMRGLLFYCNDLGGWIDVIEKYKWNYNWSIKCLITDDYPIKNLKNYSVYRLKEGQQESMVLLSDAITELSYIDNNWSKLPSGAYQYAVKAKYGENDMSETVLTNTLIKGDCTEMQISDFPYFQGFEYFDSNIPACWNQEHEDGSINWQVVTSNTGNPASAYDGNYKAYFFSSISFIKQKTKLVTPQINLSEQPNPILSFWHVQRALNNRPDVLRIFYKTSIDEIWTLLEEYNTNVANWTQRTILLPNGTSDYYLAFEGEIAGGYGIHLDNITIESSVRVNVSVNLPEGGIVTGADDYGPGSLVTITATPASGYRFVNWIKDGVEFAKSGNFSFTAVDNIELIANFEYIGENNYQLFPNPFKDEITVTNAQTVKNIQIINIYGQKVKEVELNGDTFSTNDISTGVYFIMIENVAGKKIVQKMIKK